MLYFLLWVMSTLASTLLLFLNHTHISKKGTASECRGSAGVFRWGTLALALLCVPRLQQAWGALARGDSLELNIVVNGIQQIAEGLRKLPVLQASRSCDHGPDTIRAGAMSARRATPIWLPVNRSSLPVLSFLGMGPGMAGGLSLQQLP